MNVRFYNARILTMEEPLCVLTGEVWVQKDTIVGIFLSDEKKHQSAQKQGVKKKAEKTPVISRIAWDREIDCQNNLLMPGFKNAHTHSPMVLFRSMADDEPLQGWLEKRIFPIEAKLTDRDLYELTKLSVLEYLSAGITSVFDMYLSPLATGKAFTECKMRHVQVSGLNDFVISPEKMEEYYLQLNEQGPLSSYCFGVHAEYTCSYALLEKVARLIEKYKAPFFTHNSETAGEVESCRKKYGKTPMALLCDLGLYDYGGAGFHCIHLTEHDLALMKEKKIACVTNPASNLKLASGIAPISTFLKQGINVAIGTDGAGSNNCLDMFREMFLVTALAKYKDQDATSVDALEVLKMATVNGARVMGLTDCDTLSEGKKADLIMLDLHQPNMQPLNHIAKNIVYSASKQNVKLTMIGGEILYEDGNYKLPYQTEEIYKMANDIANRVR